MTVEELLSTCIADLPGQRLKDRAVTSVAEVDMSPPGEPRNETEARICRIWSDILRVPRIGPESNFFEIGGYSLHVVQLFHALEREFGTHLPFTVLFEAPTVELLAAAIRHEELRSFRCLVPIHPAGTRPPLFLVHSYLIYEALGRSLGEDQPLYGLLEPPIEHRAPPYRLEDAAALYAGEIERVQPEGPCCIAGWCAAGIIALEVARQLELRGRTVGLLGLIDAWCPVLPPGARARRVWSRTIPEWKGQVWRVVWRRLAGWRLNRSLPLPKWLWDASELTFESIRRFDPKPVSCPIVVFRAEAQDFRPYDDEWCGWKPWSRTGVTLVPVPGNHLSMFHEPQLRVTAARIRENLKCAEERQECCSIH